MIEVNDNPNIGNQPRYFCIIPAAGIGARMGASKPKSYLSVCGQSIFAHTISKLLKLDWLSKVVVVVAENDRYWSQEPIVKHNKVSMVIGGAERYLSVLNGIESLNQNAQAEDWVLVHDIARPCVLLSDIENLRAKLSDDMTGGILATPVKETLKRVNNHQNTELPVITETVSREDVWMALTPQMFRYSVLRSALQAAVNNQKPVTDESDAVERWGASSQIVQGSADNIKVTLPEDLLRAERILSQA